MRVVRGYSGRDEEPHTRVPRPVSESIRFRLRSAVLGVTLIFPRAPARMPLLKNPPVCRLSVNQSVIMSLIGTFPYGRNDRSPYGVGRHGPKARPWCAPIILLPCSHTHRQDMCLTTHKLPLDNLPIWCYHARVHVCGHIPMRAHIPPGLAVSHTDGLSHPRLCVCLGVGVWAVLGPIQRRFAFVLIQTTQLA